MSLRPYLAAEQRAYFARQLFDQVWSVSAQVHCAEQADRVVQLSKDMRDAEDEADALKRAIERVNGRLKVTCGEVHYFAGMADAYDVEVTVRGKVTKPGVAKSHTFAAQASAEVLLKAWPEYVFNELHYRASLAPVGPIEQHLPFQFWNALAVLSLTQIEQLALVDLIQMKASARLWHAFQSGEV